MGVAPAIQAQVNILSASSWLPFSTVQQLLLSFKFDGDHGETARCANSATVKPIVRSASGLLYRNVIRL
jgi:hypothetical protein